jgi:hypothetical protein
MLALGGHFLVLKLIAGCCNFWRKPKDSGLLIRHTSQIANIRIVSEDLFVPYNDARDRIERYDAHEDSHHHTSALGWSWLQRHDRQHARARPRWPTSVFAHEHPLAADDLVIVNAALLIALTFAGGEGDSKNWGTADNTRGFLQLQLQEVDWWLLHNGGSLAACETRAIVRDAIKNAKSSHGEIEPSIAEFLGKWPRGYRRRCRSWSSSGSLSSRGNAANSYKMSKNIRKAFRSWASLNGASSIPEDGSATSTSSREVESNIDAGATEAELKKAERIAMRIILIFRAVIWTAYIYTAADVSCVYWGGLGDEVVQIL